MYIAYLWVDSWLKLMSACAEQMQLPAAAAEGNGAAEGELEQLKAAHSAELAQLRAGHAAELEQLQGPYAAELEQLRTVHGAEVELLRGRLADAEMARQARG